MSPLPSREIRLASRPTGVPDASNFEAAAVEIAAPAAGEVRVRNRWMSVDPYMRGRMVDRPSYVLPFQLGEPLQGGAIGEVVDSADPAFQPGDLVSSMLGWREAFVAPASALQKIEPREGVEPQAHLGVLGMPGLTAWAGLFDVGGLKEGETVFVSAAAGAVGSAACQMAKAVDATVIGTAGGPEKVDYLRSIGVDHAIDYRATPDLKAALKQAAPKGVHLYFDNVGGDHLEAALDVLRPFGRAALCGMISVYNDEAHSPGPSNMPLIVGKRLKLRGFIVFDHLASAPEATRRSAEWVRDGRLTASETVVEGIDNAPEAFIRLFTGDKIGKMLVRL